MKVVCISNGEMDGGRPRHEKLKKLGI